MRRYRSVLALLLVVTASVSACFAAEAKLKQGDYVAVIGDSITEQRLYSIYIEDYLLMCQPAADLRVTQFGWGGETAPGYAGRMANDTLRFRPTAATTCFGMNDGGYSPMDPAKAERYRDGQKSIVAQMKKANVRLIVVGSPGVVDADTFGRNNPEAAAMYNKTLAALRDIARQVAQDEGVVFANVFDPMMEAMTKVRVTWGQASKEFPAAELAKGINLAAEFLDNPFSEPFRKVEGAIAQKQGMEVGLVKNLIHNLPAYIQALPEERATLERIADALVNQDKAARDAAAAAVQPVRHTLKIETVP